MKKFTSILLVFAIALSCFVFVGCDTEDKLGFFKERKIKRDYIEQFDIRGKNIGDVVLDYYGGNYNGYEIVMLDTECHDPETRTEQIGDVSITYYDSNQLYAWGDEGFYSLDSAYKSGVLSEANLNELVSRFNERVTHFRDTGDVHDYEPAIITSLPKDYFKNSIYFSKYSLKVTLDHKASNENIAPSIDFFGSQYVSKVISSSSNDKHLLDEDYEQQLLVHLHTENSVINLLYVKSQLEKIPGVKKVELVAMMIATKSSNDPYYQNSDDKEYQWGLDDIHIKQVWDFTTGSSEIRVGIIDSGIATHTDLINNTVSGKDFMAGNNVNLTTDDIEGHGTHIAGIIGGIGNNAVGITGINWNISLVPLQVDDNLCNNMFDIQACIDAINYATDSYETDNPIRIINLSLETMYQNDDFEEALRNYPGLIICGAGNREYDLDDENIIRYPTFYGSERCENPIDNLIVVGALDQNGNRSVWKNIFGFIEGASNYGENTVNIYAPGSDIFSTFSPSPIYENLDGTSMAAPFVTGVAALLLSINPNLTPIQLKECILNGAEDITITEITSALKHDSKKLNAWGAFMYLMENYVPQIVIPRTPLEQELSVDSNSEYYLEKNPTVKLILQFDEEFEFELSSSQGIVDITLYDSQMNEIDISKMWNNDQTAVGFVKELQRGTYYLRGNYTGGTDTLTLSVSHEHTMDDYRYYSKSLHVEACACGLEGTETSQHVVLAGSVSNHKGYCMYCGGILYLLDDAHLGIMNINKYSINGSYILPNGIIVLVDEDIEAYLNGTLVFYDKDDLPVVQ